MSLPLVPKPGIHPDSAGPFFFPFPFGGILIWFYTKFFLELWGKSYTRHYFTKYMIYQKLTKINTDCFQAVRKLICLFQRKSLFFKNRIKPHKLMKKFTKNLFLTFILTFDIDWNVAVTYFFLISFLWSA